MRSRASLWLARRNKRRSIPFSKGIFRTVLLCLFVLASVLASVQSRAGSFSSDELEAAFIGQLFNYVELPGPSLRKDSLEPFVVSVVGTSPLLQELNKLALTKAVNGRKIVIQSVESGDKIKKSHAVVILSENKEALDQTLKKLKGTGILTISQNPGFASRGVMVNFFVEGEKVRFEINAKSLKNEKITVSSQLLKLARLVE